MPRRCCQLPRTSPGQPASSSNLPDIHISRCRFLCVVLCVVLWVAASARLASRPVTREPSFRFGATRTAHQHAPRDSRQAFASRQPCSCSDPGPDPMPTAPLLPQLYALSYLSRSGRHESVGATASSASTQCVPLLGEQGSPERFQPRCTTLSVINPPRFSFGVIPTSMAPIYTKSDGPTRSASVIQCDDESRPRTGGAAFGTNGGFERS